MLSVAAAGCSDDSRPTRRTVVTALLSGYQVDEVSADIDPFTVVAAASTGDYKAIGAVAAAGRWEPVSVIPIAVGDAGLSLR